ncbi:MAG: hypothetical protein AB7H77_08585 [Bdellovibrionales bacterium]
MLTQAMHHRHGGQERGTAGQIFQRQKQPDPQAETMEAPRRAEAGGPSTLMLYALALHELGL